MRVDNERGDFPTRQLFAFNQMRKVIIKQLEITNKTKDEFVIKLKSDSSGKQQSIFDIDHLDVDLDDLKILLSLLDENKFTTSNVQSLTREHVAVLDNLAFRLGLDKCRYKYFHLSRLND